MKTKRENTNIVRSVERAVRCRHCGWEDAVLFPSVGHLIKAVLFRPIPDRECPACQNALEWVNPVAMS